MKLVYFLNQEFIVKAVNKINRIDNLLNSHIHSKCTLTCPIFNLSF
jgi:hypothetical protein